VQVQKKTKIDSFCRQFLFNASFDCFLSKIVKNVLIKKAYLSTLFEVWRTVIMWISFLLSLIL